MTTDQGKTVNLYAQWVTCTHKAGTDHPGQITYTADDDADIITETCDCDAHTEKVTLKAATVYYDEKEHPATVTKSSEAFYATVSKVSYQYRKADSDQYGNMPEGESIPKSVGHYKATITAGNRTVSVEYEIKSQSAGSSIDAIAAKGQKFSAFTGEKDVNLTLNSDVAEAKGKAYQFQAKLYAGAKDGQALIAAGETDTGVTAESLSLTVAENTNPSLKITDTTGTHRLLTTKDSTLDFDVQWKNIDRSYTVSANIQKKTSQGYEGVLLQAAVSQGKNKFSLGGITGSGSYRLVITVTKDQRTVMEVPYYFIVQ